MAIQALCSSCGHQYNLADRLQGKNVKCKECGETFVVKPAEEEEKPPVKKSAAVRATPPALPPGKNRRLRDDEDDEDRPRRKRMDDDDDDERPRRGRGSAAGSGNGMLFLILGGGVAAVLFLGLAGFGAFLLLRGGRADNPPPDAFVHDVQINPPVVNPGPIVNPGPDPFPKDKPKKNPPPIDPFNPVPKNPPPVVKWAVQPDPGPDMMAAPANPNGFTQLFGLPQFVYPSTPSPFVAVRHGAFGKESWQIIDLQKFKQVAAIGKFDMGIALSPDGKFLAGKASLQINSNTVNVFSLAESRIIQAIPIDPQAFAPPFGMIDFVENGHLITYKTQGLTGTYEVFNIASGKEVKRFTGEGLLQRKNNLALSPGRKYLAVAYKNQIDIFRPLTGERVGEIQMPPGNGMFKAIAFSPDGKELACLIEAFGSSSRLLSWKMTDGTPTVEHKFAKDVHTLVKNAFGYTGAIMEWVPDNSGWLLYGQLWVDYQSGAPVHTIAYDAKEFRYWPRRLIGKDHVVMAGGDFQKMQMGIVALPGADIAASIKAARAGAGQPVAGLPALKSADLAAARTIPAPNGNVAWTVGLDPAPTPKGKFVVQPITLRTKAQEVQQIVFAGDAGQAVVVSGLVANPLVPRKQYRADRYDLLDGRHLGTCELFGSDKPDSKLPNSIRNSLQASVSPDGARVIVRQADDPKRLDVWNLADGKHLVGWQPHAVAGIDSFAMLDADRVLTCGGNKLVLWKIPECRAVYIAEGYSGAIQLSPGRKYVVASAGASLEILEAATGARKGQLEQPGGPAGAFLSGAFSRDGTEFAAALGGQGSTLAHWNLVKGNWLGSCQGNAGDQPMAFMGKHVLQGPFLYDWNLKGALWTYSRLGLGAHGTGTPDGRHWFAATAQGASLLLAQALPDAGANSLAASIAAGNAQSVVTPGMAVQVQVNAGSEIFRTKVQTSLQNQLQTRGYKSGPGGLTIAVSAQESPTGVVLSYEVRSIGAGKIGRQIIKVNERKVVCQYIVTDAQGTVVTKNNIAFVTPGSMTFEGTEYERELNEAMWANAANWGSSVQVPTNVYRIQGQLQTLPKIGPLAGGG